MKQVFVRADNIVSPLGFSTGENLVNLRAGNAALARTNDPVLYPTPVAISRLEGSLLDQAFQSICEKRRYSHNPGSFTRLEKMLLLSVDQTLSESGIDPKDPGLWTVFSTTKGNIDLLEPRYRGLYDHRRVFLWDTAKRIRDFFGFREQPVIVSNACISGSVAIMLAMRQIRTGRYDHALVFGGDIVSEFVVSGFMSFQALSPDPCKPFDLNRKGLNIGEGAGSLMLTSLPPENAARIIIAGGATTNDANHISGPSRTGEELALAISNALREARLPKSAIGFISAHGTATPFNDEMESKAIGLAGLNQAPLNSLKGFWGHTLGAAGILESVAAINSLRFQELYPSKGFETTGTPVELNIVREHQTHTFSAALKTASGFGGCNAALVFTRI